MRKCLYPLLFLLIAMNTFAQNKNEFKYIVEKSYSNLTNSNSWSYTCDYKFKSFFNSDTVNFEGWVCFTKNQNDTLIGADYTLVTKDNNVFHYNKDTSIKLFPRDGELQLIFNEVGNEFQGNVVYDLILSDFIHYNDPYDFAVASSAYDTIYYEDDNLVIWIEPGDTLQFSNYYIKYVFDTTLLAPIEIESSVYYLDEYQQYSIWKLRDHKFTFPEEQLASTKPERASLAKLEVGASLPEIVLKDTTGQVIDRDAFNGKVVLLDFWYVSCYPCQLAMPGIQYLFDTFDEDEVLIYGVNPIDKENEKMKRLFNKRNLNYPIVKTERSMASEIGVSAYPSFILLDQEGKVVSFHEGFSEGFEKETEKEIRELLEE